MTHQDVGDADVLSELLDQLPTETPTDTIGGFMQQGRSLALTVHKHPH